MKDAPPNANGDLYWIRSSGLMSSDHEESDGWHLPVQGTVISYLYVRPADFSFEIWLGGESDITVRLQRPFTYGPASRAVTFDPRPDRKSDLGPLLEIGNQTVSALLVKRTGDLDVVFQSGDRLSASPSSEGQTWRLEWPVEGDAHVAAGPGGGLAWSVPTTKDDEWDRPRHAPPTRAPVARATGLELPIAGVVAEVLITGLSIELAVPMIDGGYYGVHFGGAIEIVEDTGSVWKGRGDAEDRSTLARYLDLLGDRVVEALVDDQEQVRLAFSSGVRLTAERATWQANWPKSDGSGDDYWVPKEGLRIP
ncbi:MAG: hypothetical protein H0U52_08335 [Chloroflexi bacterium]|nr:hypothetical protein [Chloroflexota bacterium]